MNLQVWQISFWVVIVLFQIVSIPALILRKNDLADVLWGPAFAITSFAAVFWGAGGLEKVDLRSWIILGIVSVWAVRLFFHVGLRNLSHRQEDVRYNNWRKQWGSTWLWRSYLQVFVLQPLILYVFLTPVVLSLASPSEPIGLLTYVGIGIWLIGFLFESISDEQLRRFKSDANNRGKLMTTGLWSWSRHPNYFGEVVQWWGIWIMVLELPWGWATILSPIGVTFLILKVSGVEMLEDLMKNRPGIEDYKRRTVLFFPRPPRV